MEYLKGYTIKPYEVTGTGEVLFTDGTNNDIRANQVQCGAYGYTYDPATGTCRSFTYNTNLISTLRNTSNKINGPGNTTQIGSNNIQINGENNAAEGDNTNCFISGGDNTIANGVNNVTVVGSSGTATRDGEFVVGSPAGQNSRFFLSGRTVDGDATALFVNGIPTGVTVIATEADTHYSFTIDIFAVRTGGSAGAGAVGDRALFKLQGMVINTVVTESISTIVSVGTITDWDASCVVSSDDLYLEATGVEDMNISWQANARFTKIIL